MPVRPIHGYPLNSWQRWLLAAISLALTAGFLLACRLEPNPEGLGTHEQFGWPPCSFRLLLGIRCPSCGGTTSFAHFVRGQMLQAWQVNPAAFVLAVTCLGMIPWSWYSIWQRRLWKVEHPELAALLLLSLIGCLAVLHWGWRLIWG